MEKNNLINFFRAAYLVVLIIFIGGLFYTNGFDWDHFYAAFESDYRSWMNFELPVWSYQMCGGVPRVADPQSFGVSPIFPLVLIFGPQTSVKLIFLAGFLLGFRYFKKYSEYCGAGVLESEFLAFSITFCSFHMWHATVGHLTFALIHLVMGILYFVFKSLDGKNDLSDKMELGILCFVIMSSGFYPALIYVIVPLAVILTMSVITLALIKNIKGIDIRKLLMGGVLPALVGIVPAIPRLLPVISEQSKIPRKLGEITEYNSLLDIIVYFISPVYKLGFLFDTDSKRPWMVWEYSHFSLPFLVLIVGLIVLLFRKQAIEIPKRSMILSAWVLAVGLLMGMGDFGFMAPFSILKEKILANSLRVPSRYFYLVTISIYLLGPWIFRRQLYGRVLIPVMAFTVIISGARAMNIQHFTNAKSTHQLYSLERKPVNSMVYIANTGNQMYGYMKSGGTILNCYNPMNKKIHLSLGRDEYDEARKSGIHFLEAENKECLKGSTFSENRIFIAKNCESACLRLNRLNEQDESTAKFEYVEEKKRYCLRK